MEPGLRRDQLHMHSVGIWCVDNDMRMLERYKGKTPGWGPDSTSTRGGLRISHNW